MNLMPQLSMPFAELLAQDLRGISIKECYQHRRTYHINRVYSSTGGTRISEDEYSRLCKGLSDIAEKCGYPDDSGSARMKFDIACAIFLHKEFKITDNEAAKSGMWNFLSCCALPDLVRWRWHSKEETAIERFLSGNRNSFERLWWRASAYHDGNAKNPYWLVEEIGEDESVGIMERTTLSGVRSLVVILLRTLVQSHKLRPQIARSELMRDAMKRVHRVSGVVAIETLSETEISELCSRILVESMNTFSATQNAKSPLAEVNASMKGKPAFNMYPKRHDVATDQEISSLEYLLKRNQGKGSSRNRK